MLSVPEFLFRFDYLDIMVFYNDLIDINHMNKDLLISDKATFNSENWKKFLIESIFNDENFLFELNKTTIIEKMNLEAKMILFHTIKAFVLNNMEKYDDLEKLKDIYCKYDEKTTAYLIYCVASTFNK